MKNIKFNEWQEMALKKDMETIIKKLNTQEPIIYSLCWEIVLALGVIIVDRLFDTESLNVCLWVSVVILAVLPPIAIIIYKMYKWISAINRVNVGKYDVKNMVDIFDNQVCYWVMMCNSYCNLLSDLKDKDKKNEKVFLYQEGCYYSNKSMQALYRMKPIVDKVFSNEKEKIIKNKNIAVYRLLSLLEMMNQYQLDLDGCVEDIKDDFVIREQAEINETYQTQICQFVDDVNTQFSKQFVWKKVKVNN